MATITATTGSIDVNGIVSQLMAVERAPLAKLDKSKSALQTKLTSVGKISSALSAFQDAARALTTSPLWQSASGSSANDKAVAVTASSGAPIGTYEVQVSQLAQRQSGATGLFASATAVVGGGTLQIQMGNSGTDGDSFTADPDRAPTTITIAAGATVNDVVAAINSSDSGVLATTVKDGTGYRILLRGRDSGADGAFQVTAAPGSGSGLGALAFDPAVSGGAGIQRSQAARDANFSLGGLELTAPGNQIENVLNNVSLSLNEAGPASVAVSVKSDTDAIRAAVQKFVTAYNDLNKVIRDETKYDPGTKTAAALQGDNTFVSLQTRLRQIVSGMVGTGKLTRLSDAGISLQTDGSLSLDEKKFNTMAADPAQLRTLFGNADPAVPGNVGIASRFVTFATDVLKTDGSISGSQERLKRQMSSIDDQQSRLEQRLTETEKRLLRTYSSLNSSVSAIQSSGSSLNIFNNNGSNSG